MNKKEKFGRLVLLEEIESGGLGHEYRAAKLGPAGLERIVTVLRLQPAVFASTQTAKSLIDQAKLAAQLQNPNIVKILSIGKVEQSYYICYEHVEGRSLRAILDRCRQEAFPLSVEHALLVASKVCRALEYAHARRHDSGARYFHGLITPRDILVSYEGEVRVKGFGYWPSLLREAAALRPEQRRYLAPEQEEGGESPRSDIYSLGAILFEALAGQVPEPGVDLASRIAAVRLLSPDGDDASAPAPIVEILRRSLAADPAERYPEVSEMRKAIDTLLFSGDLTPTTFNLAFFMHSLYRNEIERESRVLKEEREASYLDYLAEEPAPAAPATAPAPRPPAAARAEVPLPAERAFGTPHDSTPSVREASTGLTFHGKGAARSRRPLVLGAAAVILVAGGLAYDLLVRPASPPPPPTSSPEAITAQAPVNPGTLVNLADADVIPPVLEKTPDLGYPPIALRQRVEGVVELNVLVDEKGTVTDAEVVAGVGGTAGLNEAAIENVKGRRYRPATKQGVPVRVWMSVLVKFELPK